MKKIHRTEVQLRFSDIDMLMHVNNAKFPTFMELSRIQYFSDIIAPRHNWKETGLIVASYSMDFKIPIYFTDQLYVETEVTAIGNKSMTIIYRFIVEGDTGPILKAMGSSVMVCFDYLKNVSAPVPDLWREKVNEFQESNF
jgi:acyl-CoA thioester hydrolase